MRPIQKKDIRHESIRNQVVTPPDGIQVQHVKPEHAGKAVVKGLKNRRRVFEENDDFVLPDSVVVLPEPEKSTVKVAPPNGSTPKASYESQSDDDELIESEESAVKVAPPEGAPAEATRKNPGRGTQMSLLRSVLLASASDRWQSLDQSVQLVTLTQVHHALLRMEIDGQVVCKLRPFPPSADFCEKIEDPCVIQPEYRSSVRFGSSGVDLLVSYYNRQHAANIVVPKFKDGRPVSIEQLPDVAHDLFGKLLCRRGNVRGAFLLKDGLQCVPVICIQDKYEKSGYEVQAILVADSRGGDEGDAAQVLDAKFEGSIDVYRVDERRSDNSPRGKALNARRSDNSPSGKALSWVDGVKFAATITGLRGDDYILPNMVQELSDRSKRSAVRGSGRVKAVTLPFELAKLSQLNDFITAQREGEKDTLQAIEKHREFRREHQVTVQMDDGNGGIVSVQKIDWLRKESFEDAELMQIEYYNQQMVASYEGDWNSELQNKFAQSLKEVRRE